MPWPTTRPWWWCARSATSRCSPTSPRTATTSAASARTGATGRRPLASTLRGLFADALERGTTRAEGMATLAKVRVTPGAHRPPHGGAAPQHARHPARHRRSGWAGSTNADLLEDERAAVEAELRRLVATLWQTRMLRAVKLGVKDEIENALAYFDYTFIDAVPRIHVEIEDSRRAASRARRADPALPTVMSIGSWVGGDRDGNPFVTAEMLEHAFRRQAEIAFDHYFAEVHALGAELPVSGLLVQPHARDEGAGGRLRRPVAVPPGRALSPGAHRRVRAAGGDGRRAGAEARAPHRRGQGRALCGRRGVRDRPRRDRHEPARGQLRDARRRAAAPAAARRAHLRLPPRHGGPAPERRRARAGDRGAPARGARGARLPGARRGRRGRRSCSRSWPRRGRCARRSRAIPSSRTGELAIVEQAAKVHAALGPEVHPPVRDLQDARACRTCSKSR